MKKHTMIPRGFLSLVLLVAVPALLVAGCATTKTMPVVDPVTKFSPDDVSDLRGRVELMYAVARAAEEKGDTNGVLVAGRMAEMVGRDLVENGWYNEGVEVLDRSLEIKKMALASDDAELADLFTSLGDAYLGLANYDKSQENYDLALNIRLKKLPKDHPYIADSYYNLANLAHTRGDSTEATKLLKKAMVHAADPFTFAYVRSLRGDIYFEQGQYSEAVVAYKQALDVYLSNDDSPAVDVTVLMTHLARALERLGQVDNAFEIYANVFQLQMEFLPKHHPITLTTLVRFSVCTAKTGHSEEAYQILNQTLPLIADHLGTDHPLYADTLYGLALANKALGKNDEAIKDLEQSLKIWNNVANPDIVSKADALYFLAWCYQDQGDQTKAKKTAKKAMTLYRTLLKKEAPQVEKTQGLLNMLEV